MTFLMVLAHGASGPLDEFIEFGLPLILLIGLWVWSNRKPNDAPKRPPDQPERPADASKERSTE